MTVSVKVYGGEFDGLTISFDPGPPPDAIQLMGGSGWDMKGTMLTVGKDKWYEYILEWIDPKTGLPFVPEEGTEAMIPVYVPEPIVKVKLLEKGD